MEHHKLERFNPADVLFILAGETGKHKARSFSERVTLFLVDDPEGLASAIAKELSMTPTHEPAASASAKTARITPSRLRLLAQREHEEWLLDEALRETFPASDPIAVTIPASRELSGS